MVEGSAYDGGLPTRWATHVFREHNKDADLWVDKGAKGRVGEWVDTAPSCVVRGHWALWVLGRHIDHGLLGSAGLVAYLQEVRAGSGS